MCGIAGYFDPSGNIVPPEPIESMLLAQRHRGPDGYGVFISPTCVLGHARLSIIDLAGGWQPIFNENGNVVITFNGEIYNFIEVRAELEAKGHRFRTQSDTEVIVHAYEEWGEESPTRFNGQFSFAVYDRSEHTLFLCRDRLGVRPLYYGWSCGLFVFASEVKGIYASGFLSPEISIEGVSQIFSCWSNIFPDTPFSNIRELPPAHTLRVSRHGSVLRRYWSFPQEVDNAMTVDAAVEGTLRRLSDSVRLRLRADVPVGAYLSGGLDSALTVAMIRKHTSAVLKTFSVEFEDSRFDESRFQGEMVRHFGTDHASIRCGPKDIVDNFENVIWATERPVLRTAPVPMYLLSRLVRSQGYKVVVTGEGADEFFLGYDIFKEAKVREFCSRMPDSGNRVLLVGKLYPAFFRDSRIEKFQKAFFLKNFRKTGDPFYGHRIRWDLCRRIRDFYSKDAQILPGDAWETQLLNNLSGSYSSLSVIQRTQRAEIETLLSGYLLSSQGDRVGMANSIEGRFAFLDHVLIEFAARIPHFRNMPGLDEKYLLKRIGRGLIPESVLRRTKFPYRAPDIESFLKIPSGRDMLIRETEPSRLRDFGLFDPGKVKQLVDKVMSARNGNIATSENLVLMAVLSGQIFQRIFSKFHAAPNKFGPGDKVLRANTLEDRCQSSM